MGGITELFPKDQFYTEASPGEFCMGQICWVPTPIIDDIPRILDIERHSPEEHDKVNFVLRNANQHDDFRLRDRGLPIKYLNLQSHEELLVQRAKKRPAIIVSKGLDVFPEIQRLLPAKGRKHLQQDALFVVPLYSIDRDGMSSGFIREMMPLIESLLYRQFFYLPASSCTTEGVARFDRMQIVVNRSPSAIEPCPVCLSDKIFPLFLGMLLYCLSGEIYEELRIIRDILKEAIEEAPSAA